MHLITKIGGTRGLTAGRCPRGLVIPGGEEGACVIDREVGLPLRLGGLRVGVQLEGCAEGHAHIGGADVEDVAGVTGTRVAGGIDKANYAVVRGRLTPFRYSPVKGAGVHTGEAAITAPGRCEGGTCVGVGPGIAAVSGAVDFVGPVANAPSRVVHGGGVNVARDLVAGDLDVAEGGVGQLSLGPGDTVVSREADEDIKAAIEVVPGNVHSAVKLRVWVVLRVARLSIVCAAGVNASANGPGEAAVSGRPVGEAL